jgi:hypothetical protein
MQEYVRRIQKIMPISNKNSEGEIYVDFLKGTNYRENHSLDFFFDKDSHPQSSFHS